MINAENLENITKILSQQRVDHKISIDDVEK